MEFLLDTHTFLWFIKGDRQLSKKAKSTIENSNNTCFVSIATFWEIAIKLTLRKIELTIPFVELKTHVIDNGFLILPITVEHTANLLQLKLHHRDPFDRLIIAQAITDQLTIISKDSNFNRYKISLLW